MFLPCCLTVRPIYLVSRFMLVQTVMSNYHADKGAAKIAKVLGFDYAEAVVSVHCVHLFLGIRYHCPLLSQ